MPLEEVDGRLPTVEQFKTRSGVVYSITLDRSRDSYLTEFGKRTLEDRYLMPGEDFQRMFARVATWFADDAAHAQRLYDYISKLWFMPATPVLSNGGTQRGLPISCFLNAVEDSLDGIVGTWNENVWLAARGGGIGTSWSKVRSIGEKVGEVGKTSGIIPFLKVMDSQTLAISQGSLRRGSAAVYLDISHPEIEEFVEVRRPTGGDPNRKTLNVHNAVVISDEFMNAVDRGESFALKSPKDGSVVKMIDARALWVRLLTARIETGEPYILFKDTTNRLRPEHHKVLGLEVTQSNLCSEITLPTGRDHRGEDRTAVCCLSSLNLERYDEWSGDEGFIKDVMIFLDNVLQDFIARTAGVEGFKKARYSAMSERSIGLGVMGFQSYLQSRMIPFESAMAKSTNLRVFKDIKSKADKANLELAHERGACPDALDAFARTKDASLLRRFSNVFAVAPTASISIIAGSASPGIEPFAANSFTQKTLSGSHNVRNRHLAKLLDAKYEEHAAWSRGILRTEPKSQSEWLAEIWSSITTNGGSVQHLDILDEYEKDVFKTAFEIDQRWVIEHAADRAPFICQAQSLNLFLPANVHKRDLHFLHFTAWKKGIKSLYYCRSLSMQRADVVSHVAGEMPQAVAPRAVRLDYDECLACQ